MIEGDGGRARFVAADLTDVEAVRGLVDELGVVDVLVNNAGTSWFGPTAELDAATFDELFDGNVRSAYFLVAGIAPGMAARGSGSIINVASMAGQIGLAGGAAYGATKAALSSLTRSWAAEFSPQGVRVNAVAAGPVFSAPGKSDRIERAGPDHVARTRRAGRRDRRGHRLPRLGQGELPDGSDAGRGRRAYGDMSPTLDFAARPCPAPTSDVAGERMVVAATPALGRLGLDHRDLPGRLGCPHPALRDLSEGVGLLGSDHHGHLRHLRRRLPHGLARRRAALRPHRAAPRAAGGHRRPGPGPGDLRRCPQRRRAAWRPALCRGWPPARRSARSVRACSTSTRPEAPWPTRPHPASARPAVRSSGPSPCSGSPRRRTWCTWCSSAYCWCRRSAWSCSPRPARGRPERGRRWCRRFRCPRRRASRCWRPPRCSSPSGPSAASMRRSDRA